jgi:hypothetical protein
MGGRRQRVGAAQPRMATELLSGEQPKADIEAGDNHCEHGRMVNPWFQRSQRFSW